MQLISDAYSLVRFEASKLSVATSQSVDIRIYNSPTGLFPTESQRAVTRYAFAHRHFKLPLLRLFASFLSVSIKIIVNQTVRLPLFPGLQWLDW